MLKLSHIKILPVMIAVAFLAFTVRLADVATSDMPNLSASAHAEDAPKEEPEAMAEDEAYGESEEQLAAADTEQQEAQGSVEDGASEAAETEKPGAKWRDASDSSLDYDKVKVEMFEDLAERRAELEQREKELLTREAMLTAAERELDRKYKEMTQLRNKIEALLEEQSEEEKKRIQSLVKIYEGMKPKSAASIFNTLDLDVLVAVMAEMSERRLSPILASMNPERARTVTIILAEQKKLPDLPR